VQKQAFLEPFFIAGFKDIKKTARLVPEKELRFLQDRFLNA